MEPLYYTLLVKSKYVLKRLNTSTIQCKSSSDRKVENAKAISVAQCQVGKETKTTNKLFFYSEPHFYTQKCSCFGISFLQSSGCDSCKNSSCTNKEFDLICWICRVNTKCKTGDFVRVNICDPHSAIFVVDASSTNCTTETLFFSARSYNFTTSPSYCYNQKI